MSFTFIKSLSMLGGASVLEDMVQRRKPYAVILATGTWDFDPYSCTHHSTGSNWEVWNAVDISSSVWEDQLTDDMHFGRQSVNSREHLKLLCQQSLSNDWGTPGMLEIQYAQSLLNALFYNQIPYLRGNATIGSGSLFVIPRGVAFTVFAGAYDGYYLTAETYVRLTWSWHRGHMMDTDG